MRGGVSQIRHICKRTPKKHSKDEYVKCLPGSQVYTPLYCNASFAAKQSVGGHERAGASMSKTLPPAQLRQLEKSSRSRKVSNAGSSYVLDSVLVSPGNDKQLDVSGLDEAGAGPEDLTEKQTKPEQADGAKVVQMPLLNWLDLLKPGNKLANGVVIWYVSQLLGEWQQDDF